MLLEQWNLLAMQGDETVEIVDQITDEIKVQIADFFEGTQQVIKVLISFFQVNTSFLNIFPTVVVDWPVSFSQLMSPVMLLLEPISLALDSFSDILTTFDYVKTTYVLLLWVVSVTLSFVIIYQLT